MQIAENQHEKINISSIVIRKLLDYTGLNAQNLAEKLEITPTQMSRYRKGVTPTLSLPVVGRILSLYPELSRDFLLTGSGEMLKDGKTDKPEEINRELVGLLSKQLEEKDKQIETLHKIILNLSEKQ